MKRLIALLTAVAVVTGVFASERILKPDFAYPKTVLKSADSLYEASVRSGDVLGQLEALMLSNESKSLIDRDTRPESIKRVLTVASGVRDRQMHALFDIYAAKLVSNYYRSNSWKFNQRDLPLTPRPADMSEWSGGMFNTVIDSLCQRAWDNAGDMPLTSLTRVIEADRLTLQYFPTLSDFVASVIPDVADHTGDLYKRVEKEAMLRAKAGSPRYYYLLGRQMQNYGKKTVDFANAFMNAQDRYNALVLWQFVKYILHENNSAKNKNVLIAALDEALNIGKGSWAEPMLNNFKRTLLQKRMNVRVSDIIPAGSTSEIKIYDACNIDTLTLTVRKYADYNTWINANDYSKKSRPVSTRDFSYIMAGKADTTLNITLEAGYYVLSVNGLSGNVSTIFSPFVPVFTSTETGRHLTVADAVTGRPVKGVAASLLRKGKTTWSGVTDADGRVSVPNNRQGELVLKKGGISLQFDYVSRLERNNYRRDNASVTITTDLGVVNPGDSIRWLLTAGADGKMCEGLDLDVVLNNAERKNIDTAHVVTDGFGRATGAFLVPADSKTGNFSIRVSRNRGKGMGASGRAYFSVADFKLRGAKLSPIKAVPNGKTVTVSGAVTNYSGTGLAGAEVEVRLLADTTLVQKGLTGSDGKFEFTYDIPKGADWCTASVDAIAPDGTTVSGSTSFDARYRASLNLSVIGSPNVDAAKGLDIKAVVISAAGDTVAAPLQYTLKLDEKEILKGEILSDNDVRIKLDGDILPDSYTLYVSPADTTLCGPKSLGLTIYRTDTDRLPQGKVMWMPNDSIIAVNGTVYVTAVYNTEDGGSRFESHELKGGYHNLYEAFVLADAVYGDEITLFAVRNGKPNSVDVSVMKRKVNKIDVTIESFRDKVVSGARESWNFRVTDAEGKGVSAAVAVNVYDSRLNQLRAPDLLRFSLWRPRMYSLTLRDINGYAWENFVQSIRSQDAITVETPQWRWISGPYGGMVKMRGAAKLYGARAPMVKEMAVEYDSSVTVNDMLAEAVPGLSLEEKSVSREDAGEDGLAEETAMAYGAAQKSFDDVELRTDDKYSALWQPMLNTDADGRLTVPFDVPNSNTAWQMNVSAWTKDGYCAAIRRTFTSNKPVTVSLNAPQFVRAGDEVTVQALLVNSTDAEREVNVQLESNAGAGEPDVYTRKVTLPASGNTTLPIAVKVPVTADSIRFVIRAISGDNSDGEAVKLAVLPSQSRVTESRNFYLNPGQDSWSAEVPVQKGIDFEAQLSYTGNPMWTVVSALPELTGDVLPTAGSQARAYFGAAVTLSLMKEHPELELKYSKSKLKGIMDGARKVLDDLQNTDGGWMWGSWCNKSSDYVTADVLDLMATLKRSGMLDDRQMEKMIERALPYYDSSVRDTDMRYTITRSAFKEPAMSLNGRKVVNATIQYINKNWKKFDTPQKALAACALEYTGNKSMARTLLGSIDQFGTQTKDKGFEFKNVRSLLAYAWLLECYGAISPESSIIDGIRQYLIVRRQGEAWGNGTLTSWVVASMINSGTPWTVPAGKVTVSVDGRDTVPAMQDKFGTFEIKLDGNDVRLTRADATTPAYGALVTRYTAQSADVRAFSDGEISIEKKLNVQNADGSWRAFDAATDTLRVGQKVRTLLTVKTDRPMSRVIVTDQRAATLIPVIQLSGWIYGEGIMAYYENRTAATNLYLEYVPKGTYQLQYDFTVNNAGTFNSGVAEATCQQAPTLTAHSSGCLLRVVR
ncbi:MAG: alpha-2-macroglobulin family protein [Muribaculaceae bacterium]